MARKLSPKQEKFVKLYHKTGNATKSYLDAGYKCKDNTARTQSSLLLTKPNIVSRLEGLQKGAAKRAQISVDKLIEKNAEIAFADLNEAVKIDSEGLMQFADKVDANLLDGVSFSSSKSSSDTDKGSSESRSQSFSIKLSNKVKALQELARLTGAYPDGNKSDDTRDRFANADRILESLRKFKR